MKKFIYFVVGLLLGAVFMGMIIWNMMPNMMILDMESKFDFDTTAEMLEENAFDNGWEVVNVIDIQDRLQGGGHDFLRMKIIEICHVEHSYTIFQAEENKRVAAIMPCRFAVYELYNGKTMISKMNIGLLSKMFGGLIQKVMGNVASEENLMLKDVIK